MTCSSLNFVEGVLYAMQEVNYTGQVPCAYIFAECCNSSTNPLIQYRSVYSFYTRFMDSVVFCSGMKGGSVLNPINALAKLIAGMMDEDNHIKVKGFYE